MENKHQWISIEKQYFGKVGTEYDFKTKDPIKAQERLAKIQEEQAKLTKNINKKVMSMFEKAEAEYKNLKEKNKL